ncbi:VOC family protein [Sphingomonas sp. 1P06PA]|uniref:VOC family protein n=1 Tax=Sphingomonas sp. 1P06PA TaxID=554121 RepID=UPI0039A432C6
MTDITHGAVAILPATDLAASRAFYERLGFKVSAFYPHHGYCIMHDANGASLHLTAVTPGSVDPARNTHGVYLYSADVAALAEAMGVGAEPKPWGLLEFAVSDPDGTLIRVGWPID